MRKKLQLSAVLLAWLMATGSHWDLVQSFAWGRMIATYAQSMPLLDAVRMTFTPDNMCSVCKLVNAAQQQQSSDATTSPGGKLDSKIPLLFQPAPSPVIPVPAFASWSLSDFSARDATRDAPPLPPPRTLV